MLKLPAITLDYYSSTGIEYHSWPARLKYYIKPPRPHGPRSRAAIIKLAALACVATVALSKGPFHRTSK
jgi:hypothetical protein